MIENSIISNLKRGLLDLPGEVAHQQMIPFRALSSEALKHANEYKISAVTILFYANSEDGSWNIVLTERQDYGGKHSGQIAFPGGKKESYDLTALDAALRETSEEIGVPPDSIEIIGKITDVYIPVSRFLVHPFVGIIIKEPHFIPEEKEVKSIFNFPLDDLLSNNAIQSSDIKNHDGMVLKNIPCFIVNNKIVWGATALMLNELREILLREDQS